ncbi:hypothetical protein ACWT_5796 [Actinoplanes sp. SE50]|uniref:hypothetical protein n=1 Tax=unclassified Actinoplanes TaxID=2626549 RepID=UPI00023ED699|nr:MULTISPECIES: hypothetical protein [unclassified Actinoplanes]AEV86814.1 hypothetical protein ACPL_5927 [Actinoplanes sp. SE50/110]ATO85211.1 hypothetical protein ACWT_5796 [Actinoplanes sp. SE50]SLM02621.1 hypothetical protein ACSP50_5903 [Actinoplanes sp. SE50/110]
MTSTLAEVRMSDAVRRLLGPDLTARVAATPLAGGRCQDCHLPLPQHSVVNVVVFQDQDSCVVGCLHPDCGTSQIRLLPAGALARTGPASVPMRLVAGVMPHGGRPLPVLTLQPIMQVVDVARPVAVDAFLDVLVQAGMTTELDFLRAPEPLLGWPVAISQASAGQAAIQIRMPGGALLVDGVTAVSPAWRDAASRYGWCVLYAGRNLGDIPAGQPHNGSLPQAGLVAGARLRLFGASRNLG